MSYGAIDGEVFFPFPMYDLANIIFTFLEICSLEFIGGT